MGLRVTQLSEAIASYILARMTTTSVFFSGNKADIQEFVAMGDRIRQVSL